MDFALLKMQENPRDLQVSCKVASGSEEHVMIGKLAVAELDF